MRNRLIITISDIHGSRQYSVHEMIKKIIFFGVLIFLLVGVLTALYIKMLNGQVLSSEKQILTLKNEGEALTKHNIELNNSNNALITLTQNTTDKLTSLDEQLREVEELLGVGPDTDGSDDNLTEKVLAHEEKSNQEVIKLVKAENISAIQKALLINSIPNGKPLKYRRISSKFGYRIHPVTKSKSFHAGMDLPASHGTPIYAPASGIVSYAREKGMYGNFLLLTHSYGFQTAYGHLSRYAVKEGDFVTKGQRIAYVGSTGRSTGPHLHYELRYLTKWLNPKDFMEWDLDNINEITDKIKLVNWKSILAHTEQLITLSTK